MDRRIWRSGSSRIGRLHAASPQASAAAEIALTALPAEQQLKSAARGPVEGVAERRARHRHLDAGRLRWGVPEVRSADSRPPARQPRRGAAGELLASATTARRCRIGDLLADGARRGRRCRRRPRRKMTVRVTLRISPLVVSALFAGARFASMRWVTTGHRRHWRGPRTPASCWGYDRSDRLEITSRHPPGCSARSPGAEQRRQAAVGHRKKGTG